MWLSRKKLAEAKMKERDCDLFAELYPKGVKLTWPVMTRLAAVSYTHLTLPTN